MSLERRASEGSADAQRELEGPECPPAVQYLVEWAYLLLGRSGSDMNGVSPLSFTTIRDFRSEMGIDPLERHEVDALLLLDGAIRHPDERKVSAVAEAPVAARAPVVDRWPKKKALPGAVA